jgi:hypothetical protein
MKLSDSEVLKMAAEIVARQAACAKMINNWEPICGRSLSAVTSKSSSPSSTSSFAIHLVASRAVSGAGQI